MQIREAGPDAFQARSKVAGFRGPSDADEVGQFIGGHQEAKLRGDRAEAVGIGADLVPREVAGRLVDRQTLRVAAVRAMARGAGTPEDAAATRGQVQIDGERVRRREKFVKELFHLFQAVAVAADGFGLLGAGQLDHGAPAGLPAVSEPVAEQAGPALLLVAPQVGDLDPGGGEVVGQAAAGLAIEPVLDHGERNQAVGAIGAAGILEARGERDDVFHEPAIMLKQERLGPLEGAREGLRDQGDLCDIDVLVAESDDEAARRAAAVATDATENRYAGAAIVGPEQAHHVAALHVETQAAEGPTEVHGPLGTLYEVVEVVESRSDMKTPPVFEQMHLGEGVGSLAGPRLAGLGPCQE